MHRVAAMEMNEQEMAEKMGLKHAYYCTKGSEMEQSEM